MMSTPTMDKNQQRLTLLLPLFFVLFIISFPAGLEILYWITTNAWTMAQQYVIRGRVGRVAPVTTADPAAPPGRGEARAAHGEANGASAGPLTDRLRGRAKGGRRQDGGRQEGGQAARQRGGQQPSAVAPRSTAAPPPRKNKKRSGRRR